jgi:isocitrate/isopropylmalate dehydrogenase
MLLEHLGDGAGTGIIEQAIQGVISSGIKTRDLGGTAGTKEFGEAVVRALHLKK